MLFPVIWCCLTVLDTQPVATPTIKVVPTYGLMGPIRPHVRYGCHDEVALRVELTGCRPTDRGHLHLAMRMALYDEANQLAFSEPAQEGLVQPWPEAPVRIGYTWTVPPNTPPGRYRWVCTVREPNQRWEVREELVMEVQPRAYGIAALRLAHDAAGHHPAPPGGTVGQRLYVRFSVIDARAKDGQVNLRHQLEVFDRGGRRVWGHEIGLPQVAKDKVDGMIFFTLQQAGEFTLRLTSTDGNADRTAVTELPLRVFDP